MKRLLAALAALGFALATAHSARAALSFAAPFGTNGASPGQLNAPSGIATDPDGDVYVADSGNSRVEEYLPDHAFLRTIGLGQLDDPVGIAIDGQGNIFVVSTGSDQVVRFSAGSLQSLTWGTAGTAPGQFSSPTGVAVDQSGDVYVADSGNDRIEKFTNTGAYLTSWGGAGTTPGDLADPGGVAASPDGTIYVADTGNDRIQQFANTGQFITAWGSAGTLAGEFSAPLGVAISPLGYVYVADTGNDRIQRFTTSGAFLDTSGTAGPAGAPDALNGPAAAAFDPAGNAYIADRGNDQVQSGTEATQPTLANLLPPTVHQTVNAQPVSGTVLLREPGARKFTLLTAASRLPLGTVFDTRHGVVTIASRRAATGRAEMLRLYGGQFKIDQPRGALPTTQAILTGGDFSVCRPPGKASDAATIAKASKKKVVRSLWGSGQGHYTTVGHDGSAAIKDPTWLTEDRCDGTFFRVTSGTIVVHDKAKNRNVKIHAPGSYLATGRA